MNAPTKLGIALILIFSTCLLALFIELVYVLWRKRSFRQRSVVSGGPRSIDSEFSNISPFYAAPSKELLYFFCWKDQAARVEPSTGVASSLPTEAATAPESVEEDDDDEELAKWQALYGQARVLYTIKEEEQEGIESVENSADRHHHQREEKRDCFLGGTDSFYDVAIGVVDSETPFSTPCASPPYFTPSPSPDRGNRDLGIFMFSPVYDDVSSPENDGFSSIDREIGFVNLRIEG